MDISSTALFSYLMDDLRAYFPHTDFSCPHDDYWPGATPGEVAALRLTRSLFKKLDDEKAEDADELCLRKFLASDELCWEWRLNLKSSKDEELVNLFRKEIDDFLHPCGMPLIDSYFDILNRGRAGPGASIGANGTDFYTKFFSSILTSTSPLLYSLYNEYVQWYPDWVDAELSRSYNSGVLRLTRGNKLSFVRKTRDISRSICTEPSLNMFFQLGLGEIINLRLREYGIDVRTQAEKNRAMARRGSIDDSIATIDLESASDSVSLNLCREFFPTWFFEILMNLRSPEVELPGGVWHELGMVSSMGNGFTFPLQTALFMCVVRAAARFRNVKLNAWLPPDLVYPLAGDELYQSINGRELPSHYDFGHMRELKGGNPFGVFGDDICCPREIADDVCHLLGLLGFRVNHAKSYLIGPFRESCGHDYYNGRIVRGVYIRSLATMQDRYVAINRLNEWSALTGIPLPRCVGYLVDSVRYLAVPYWEDDSAGIRTMDPPEGAYVKTRYWYNYRCYVPTTPSLLIGESGDLRPNRDARGLPLKQRQVNPKGLLLSFLGGFIRNCRVSIALKQGERPRYRTSVRVAPQWSGFRAGSVFATDPVFWTSRVSEMLAINLERG